MAVTLLQAVQSLFQLFYILLLIRIVLSWVPGASLQRPAVQFVHRAFFWLIALLVLLAWWPARHRVASHVLLLAFAAQAALGIFTLLQGVPLPLAVAHQSGAVVLLAAAVWNAHAAGTWPAQRRIGE